MTAPSWILEALTKVGNFLSSYFFGSVFLHCFTTEVRFISPPLMWGVHQMFAPWVSPPPSQYASQKFIADLGVWLCSHILPQGSVSSPMVLHSKMLKIYCSNTRCFETCKRIKYSLARQRDFRCRKYPQALDSERHKRPAFFAPVGGGCFAKYSMQVFHLIWSP